MSHYSVGIIVPKNIKEEHLEAYIDKALEPFDENLEVEPYIALTKFELMKRYQDYIKNADKENALSFDEFSDDYCGYGNDEEGNALSTYNPNSKWDWYVIGGRWDGLIKTRESQEVNHAKIKDIVFKKEFDELELQSTKKKYNKLITDGEFYKPEYYQRRFPTLESYLESFNFSTYAVLDKDGKWLESGKMGWFGISSATPEEQIGFAESYMDIINSQDEDDWLVIVDCHI